jgi:chitinase
MPVYSGYVGRPLRFDGSGSYDPEGHALVYTWSFGDGTPNSQTATNYVDHTYTTRGTYSVTLTVNDGSQNSTASATSAKIIDIRWIPALLELLIQ